MPRAHPKILFVTDFSYESPGRDYGGEDRRLIDSLSDRFEIEACTPQAATKSKHDHDLVVIRNSGPVLNYRTLWADFLETAHNESWNVYNPLVGRGDMAGKEYLIEMTKQKMPVIPTVDHPDEIESLPRVARYVVKPKDGADSIGMDVVPLKELSALSPDLAGSWLVQPWVRFDHEVSFYFVDDELVYAMWAPDTDRRWSMQPFTPSASDIRFARTFLEWNSMPRGVQRIDACRLPDGRLLLVELEDLNPYLSLDRLRPADRDYFTLCFGNALQRAVEGANN
ncbi:hypothetical protein [Arthrobacter sp. 18067]|uniref:hypothetical protein n=1 Tax=Arthrobacter sp. 18067 TaxID=2681413 RepID=UPI00135BD713|nr:hypothetical protein [Arthrobacter sp. 18067]